MNIQRQTIKSLAVEFLAKKDTPCHVDEIWKYVNKYRACTMGSLIHHCSSDKHYNLAEWKKQNISAVGTVGDLMEDFLAGQDNPCHIDQVIRYISKYRSCNIDSLMQHCTKDKRFIVIKPRYVRLRSKEYDLKEWKKQHIAVVGNTCDLTEQFLAEQDAPCHISAILDYIKLYRYTNLRNFTSHIYADSRFIRIMPGYYGLKSKKYDLDKWRKQTMATAGICDLVEDYLNSRDFPCHVKEIAGAVLKYRKIYAHAILENCRLDERFSMMSGFVYLRSKKYNLDEWKKQDIKYQRTICDFAEEFLAERDVPYHVDDIWKHVIKYRKSIAQDKMKLLINDGRFINIGNGYAGLRSKKYNLDEWNKQNRPSLTVRKTRHIRLSPKKNNRGEREKQKIVRPGAIGDIAADFLASKNSLCHFKAIAQYVSNFRNFNSTRIIDYMRSDLRFNLYANGYIGLWGKDYGEKELEKQNIIRGATLGDIIQQFLVKRKASCHVDEITEYVSKYRKFDPIWIIGNLDGDKRFRILKNGQIELRNKK